MSRAQLIFKRTILLVFVLVQATFYPAVAFAETTPTQQSAADPAGTTSQSTSTPPESTSDTPPSSSNSSTQSQTSPAPASDSSKTPTDSTAPDNSSSTSTASTPANSSPSKSSATSGPTQPPGPDSKTYTKNPDGTWSNSYYTWDPSTGQTKPNTPQTYSYNPSSGMWDTSQWYYSPEKGQYVENKVSVPNPPKNATLVSPIAPNQASISNTGPSSNNTVAFNNTSNSQFNLFYDARISNAIGQMSKSGDATVQGNTLGGSALSGDASSIANVLNLLQSSWGTLGSGNISTFVANINGNVVGDLYLDPSRLPANNGNSNINVNVAESGLINNTIDASAKSGNANVTNNTTGGDATSGNANVVVNLLNLINSAISANKSFVGVLNINGSLNGDILLPDNLLQAVIASTGPNSNNAINNNNSNNLNVNVSQNQTIDNNVVANTKTGNSNVSDNTTGGSATTGKASNNVTLLNLTGQKVVAKDALLVFVNVLGEWVGLIMNAPAGSNAVAATGPNSNNTINSNTSNNLDVNVAKNSAINNNVTTNATSGDATVSHNTKGGNAKTGDANSSVNVLNMIDSSFTASDWFGVLFINVFGSWHGSFGVNTSAGNVVSPGKGGGQSSNSGASSTNDASAAYRPAAKVFNFIASGNHTDPNSNAATATASTTSQPGKHQSLAKVLAAATITDNNAVKPPHWQIWILPGAGISIALLLIGIERYFTLRKYF